MNHTSEIKLQVELDENRIPERLFWEAPDGGIAHQEAKALFLSVWDHKSRPMDKGHASGGNEYFLLSNIPNHG